MAAEQASQELACIYDRAYREFTAHNLHPKYHSGVMDLGTVGITTTAAGLVPFEWAEFQPDGHTRTRFASWLEEADRMLARLSLMAGDDLASRERAEYSLVLHEQQEREQLARLAETERKNAENRTQECRAVRGPLDQEHLAAWLGPTGPDKLAC